MSLVGCPFPTDLRGTPHKLHNCKWISPTPSSPSCKLPSRGLVWGKEFHVLISHFLPIMTVFLPSLFVLPCLFSLAVLLRLLNPRWAFLVGFNSNISHISLLMPFLVDWHTSCCFLLGGELGDRLIPYHHLEGTGNPAKCWWQTGTLLVREAERWEGSGGQYRFSREWKKPDHHKT